MQDVPESCRLCQHIIDPLYDLFSANLLVSKRDVPRVSMLTARLL